MIGAATEQKSHGGPPPSLLIIGGGSAAFSAAIRASELGAKVTIINDGLPIGGTCVNAGCVPSKTLIRAAEARHRATRHNFRGIEARSGAADFREVIAQKRELVSELRKAKYLDVLERLPGVRFIEGRARLKSASGIEVNGETIDAGRIIIATGAAPSIPPIPGLESADPLTNESAFELDELPESLIVIGGNFVGLETAQMFARLGSRVTVLTRNRILPAESADISDALKGYLEDEGIEVVTGAAADKVYCDGNEVALEAKVGGSARVFRAARILAATGRDPNTRDLGLEESGIELDDKGFIKVNDALQTSQAGVYAIGDVIGAPMFVYTAAYEGALAAENAVTGSSRERDYTALPWVIFTDPQLAGVGLDEKKAFEQRLDYEVSVLPLSEVPRALAARDLRGFVKLIRDKKTDKLLGARVLAPEGGELIMEVSLAIKYGITVHELASTFHPYLTLSEAIKLAAITFEKDIGRLSCCAA